MVIVELNTRDTTRDRRATCDTFHRKERRDRCRAHFTQLQAECITRLLTYSNIGCKGEDGRTKRRFGCCKQRRSSGRSCDESRRFRRRYRLLHFEDRGRRRAGRAASHRVNHSYRAMGLVGHDVWLLHKMDYRVAMCFMSRY